MEEKMNDKDVQSREVETEAKAQEPNANCYFEETMNLAECSHMNPEQRHEAISKIKLVHVKKPRQCEHIKPNGEFCASPALRGRHYCYFHLTHIGRRIRAERARDAVAAKSAEADANANAKTSTAPFELPPLEDAASIQIALMQVMDAILHDRIDTKRAGLLLYGLQTASSNLARADFEPRAGATVAGAYDSFEEDFELGDDAPALRVDAEPEDVPSEHAAKLAEIEELAEAYSKLGAAKKEHEANHPLTEEEQQKALETFECDPVSGFFCSISGPLSRAGTATASGPRCVERPAASQRLEVGATLACGGPEQGSGARRRRKKRPSRAA
jgi:hypothetical protein